MDCDSRVRWKAPGHENYRFLRILVYGRRLSDTRNSGTCESSCILSTHRTREQGNRNNSRVCDQSSIHEKEKKLNPRVFNIEGIHERKEITPRSC